MTAPSGAQAVANARQHTSYPPGLCQKFVRLEAWEVGSLYGSAIDAWNGSTEKHPGDRHPPIGAPCYYRGGQYGHAVIFADNTDAEIRSTDCKSTGRVSEAAIGWIEANWGYTYLGWTGDINGVHLPLGIDDDSDNGRDDDDMPTYDHGVTHKTKNLTGGTWTPITWEGSTGDGAFVEGEPGVRIGGRVYDAVLAVQVDAPGDATIRLRTVEWDTDTSTVKETNPQSETIATSGSTFAQHVQNGVCADGRRLRFQINVSQNAKLTDADAVVLSWK
jgi:hypothetical protein